MSVLFDLARKIPGVQRLKWKIDFIRWQMRSKETAGDLYNPEQTYWVPVDLITESEIPAHLAPGSSTQSNAMNELGAVVDGDWDQQTMPFADLDVYTSFEAHILNGKAWENTDLYQRVSQDITAGRERWGCKTLADFDQRLEKLVGLYTEIKTNGYKTQEQLAEASPYGSNDEIILHINRYGHYIFAEGRHRLTLAKLAGIDKVPVKIAKRHKQWEQFRCEILDFADKHGRTKGQVYHQLTHPDLADIPTGHGMQRMEMLMPYIPKGGGRLLDIGANWGFFTNGFQKQGFDCTAIEMLPQEAYFLRKLGVAERLDYKVIESSVFDLKIDMNFEVVMAMNIFHHFLKDEALYDQLCTFLDNLNTKVMFFQPHTDEEWQMQGIYKSMSSEELVQFVADRSRLPNITKIGADSDGRVMYKLEK